MTTNNNNNVDPVPAPKKAKTVKKNKKVQNPDGTIKTETYEVEVKELGDTGTQDDAAQVMAMLSLGLGRSVENLDKFLEANGEWNDAVDEMSLRAYKLTERHKNPVRRLINWVGDTWVGSVAAVVFTVAVGTATVLVFKDAFTGEVIEVQDSDGEIITDQETLEDIEDLLGAEA